MKTLKMSLENIQGKMSRMEMRTIMAGSGECASKSIWCNGQHFSCAEVRLGQCYNSYCGAYCN